MSNKTVKSKNDISILFSTLDHLDEQGKALRKTLEIAIETKNKVEEMQHDISKDIKELRDNIRIDRNEQAEIQSLVCRKATQLTKDLFQKKVSSDLFLAKSGHFRIPIYRRLKETFNVTSYLEIKKVDFKKALEVIDNVALYNLDTYQKRLTIKQKEIALMNHDDVSL